MSEEKKNILSCIQPTGDIHLGNYLGAVKNWVNLQEDYNCTYGVVDYHAMNMLYKADDLRQNSWKMIFQLMACGVKPENLFIQSLIPEHSELCWILSNVCSFGELQRMTQFKDKSEQKKDSDKDAFISSGLFFYPVLQAADILIYHADLVPVGKDQVQHLELSRNIAQRFNHQYGKGKEYFTHPEPLLTVNAKIMSLADPKKKMSKSLGEKHYVNIFGEESRIRKQVKSAVTDTGESEGMSAGVTNLFTLLKATKKDEAHASLMQDYENDSLKYSDLKAAVADGLVEMCSPISEKYKEILSDKKNIKNQIKYSSSEIRKVAQKTLKDVKELVGIMNPKQ